MDALFAQNKWRLWLARTGARRALAVVMLTGMMGLITACAVAEARGHEETTPEPSATATPTPLAASPTPFPTVDPSEVSPTPDATPKRFTSASLRVDSLVCEQFHAGAPDLDGPGHWLNVSGEVTNTGETAVTLREPAVAQVRMPGGEQGMMIVEVELLESVLEPGETYRFSEAHIETQSPVEGRCQVIFIPADRWTLLVLTGDTESEITTFAAP